MRVSIPKRVSTRAGCVCAALVLASTGYLNVAVAADVASLPAPTGYVNDFAGVVDTQSKAELEEFCTRVDHELGVQVALVTVDSTGDTPIRDYGLDLARRWKVGDQKTSQGALLLLAVKDRKDDLETLRGLEPYVTDGFAGSTLRAMRPSLRAGQYGPALLAAAHTMAQQIAQGKNIAFADGTAPPAPAEETPVRVTRHRGISPFAVMIGLFVLFWLLGRGGRRGGGGGGAGSFLTGMLLGDLLGGGRRGGGWGDGGGFGGGGGGGGFGGFGGGGDAGGGGASSDW